MLNVDVPGILLQVVIGELNSSLATQTRQIANTLHSLSGCWCVWKYRGGKMGSGNLDGCGNCAKWSLVATNLFILVRYQLQHHSVKLTGVLHDCCMRHTPLFLTFKDFNPKLEDRGTLKLMMPQGLFKCNVKFNTVM